jgi:hypothetical protein
LRRASGVPPPRIIVPGATTAITRRITHRKLLFAPFDPLVSQGWLYAMGRAQEEYDVLLHHGTQQGNHVHCTATRNKDNLPEFLRYVHRETVRTVASMPPKPTMASPVSGIRE